MDARHRSDCAATAETAVAGERREAGPPTVNASPSNLDGPSSEIALLDEAGVILAVNQAWRTAVELRGLDLPHYGVGLRYSELAQQFLPDLDAEGLERSLAAVRSGAADTVQHPYPIETARGPRWRQLRITPLKLDEGARFVAIHEDLTELARAQEALRRTSERLLTAQDDERQRIAIELHDSTSQHLAVLGLGLARLRALAPDARASRVLDDMGRALGEAVRETRVLSYLLKPTGLLQEGLVTTARRFAGGFAARTGLAVGFHAVGESDNLAAPVEHAAFRIIQEALSNAYRHAEAKRVQVEVIVEAGVLVVRVSDDGRGIRTPPGFDKEGDALGVGIVGMHARCEQLDGRLEIVSGPDGTRVEAILPVSGRR